MGDDNKLYWHGLQMNSQQTSIGGILGMGKKANNPFNISPN